MNKLVRFFLVVLAFTSFSVSAVPEPLRRMWDKFRGNSVPVNKPRQSTVKNNSLRNASGSVVETTTGTNNPYHVAKAAVINNQERSRPSRRFGAIGADDHALQNAIRRDKFTEQEKEAANNQGRSRSSGRPGAFGADEHTLQNAITEDKIINFRNQEKKAATWKVSKPTAV